MKLLVAIMMLATLASAEYTVKTRDDLIKNRDECVKELNIPTELEEKYKKWDFPNDATTHCYMKCMQEKLGLFDKDTGYNVENTHTQVVGGAHADHTDETHVKIEKCADKNTQGSDACEWAYRGAMCLMSQNLQLVQMSVHAHNR